MSHGNETHSLGNTVNKNVPHLGGKSEKKKKLIRIPKSLTHYIPEGNPLLRKIAFSPVIQQ